MTGPWRGRLFTAAPAVHCLGESATAPVLWRPTAAVATPRIASRAAPLGLGRCRPGATGFLTPWSPPRSPAMPRGHAGDHQLLTGRRASGGRVLTPRLLREGEAEHAGSALRLLPFAHPSPARRGSCDTASFPGSPTCPSRHPDLRSDAVVIADAASAEAGTGPVLSVAAVSLALVLLSSSRSESRPQLLDRSAPPIGAAVSSRLPPELRRPRTPPSAVPRTPRARHPPVQYPKALGGSRVSSASARSPSAGGCRRLNHGHACHRRCSLPARFGRAVSEVRVLRSRLGVVESATARDSLWTARRSLSARCAGARGRRRAKPSRPRIPGQVLQNHDLGCRHSPRSRLRALPPRAPFATRWMPSGCHHPEGRGVVGCPVRKSVGARSVVPCPGALLAIRCASIGRDHCLEGGWRWLVASSQGCRSTPTSETRKAPGCKMERQPAPAKPLRQAERPWPPRGHEARTLLPRFGRRRGRSGGGGEQSWHGVSRGWGAHSQR